MGRSRPISYLGMVRATYTISERHFREAQFAYAGARLWIQQGLGLYLILAGVLLIAAAQWAMAVLGVVVGALLLIGPRWAARRIYRKQLADIGEITLEMSEAGIDSSGSHGSGHLNWNGLASFLETRNLFVLIRKGNILVAVPKAAMTSDDCDAMRTLLRSNSSRRRSSSANVYRWLWLFTALAVSVILAYFVISRH